jgi:hypothetical protein
MILIFLFTFFYFCAQPVDNTFVLLQNKTWFFLISWYNYYDFFFSFTVTDLNLLREIYFYNNSFEFFLINFVLFYGIISSILACFLIKRIFSFLNVSQYINYNLLFQTNATYFIRNQNFLKQQATSTGTRVWIKKKVFTFIMIQRQTWLNVTDNTNVNWLRTFHLYKGFFRKQTTIGFFIKGSARVVESPRSNTKLPKL